MTVLKEELDAFDDWFDSLDQDAQKGKVRPKRATIRGSKHPVDSDSDTDSSDDEAIRRKRGKKRGIQRHQSGALEKLMSSSHPLERNREKKNIKLLKNNKTSLDRAKSLLTKRSNAKRECQKRRSHIVESLGKILDDIELTEGPANRVPQTGKNEKGEVNKPKKKKGCSVESLSSRGQVRSSSKPKALEDSNPSRKIRPSLERETQMLKTSKPCRTQQEDSRNDSHKCLGADTLSSSVHGPLRNWSSQDELSTSERTSSRPRRGQYELSKSEHATSRSRPRRASRNELSYSEHLVSRSELRPRRARDELSRSEHEASRSGPRMARDDLSRSEHKASRSVSRPRRAREELSKSEHVAYHSGTTRGRDELSRSGHLRTSSRSRRRSWSRPRRGMRKDELSGSVHTTSQHSSGPRRMLKDSLCSSEHRPRRRI